jgi:hypothetical protein
MYYRLLAEPIRLGKRRSFYFLLPAASFAEATNSNWFDASSQANDTTLCNVVSIRKYRRRSNFALPTILPLCCVKEVESEQLTASMKSIIPVIVGTAAIAAGIATAIASANGRFIGRAYLVPWFYAGCAVFLILAVAVNYVSRREGRLKPLIIPLRYGPSPFLKHAYKKDGRWFRGDGIVYSTEEILAGKHELGHHGLIVANHGEPAYDVSVSTAKILIGTSTLKFGGSKPVFRKADGDAFFVGTIQFAPHDGTLGSALFEEMRKFKVAEITVKLIYKDAENHWYETIGKIERDVMAVGGLSVRYVRQQRAKQPDGSES